MSYLLLGYSGWAPAKKWITSLFLAPIALYLAISRGNYSFIDNADLIIHEAGHFFFGFLGNFTQAAGGTLMQILLPLFIAFYFFRAGYRAGFQVFIFWLAQNLINISVYAADANVRKLILLGNGKHDWYYMLGELGLLNQAEMVGFLFYSVAIFVLITSLFIPLFHDE